jgi:hypothetical protein
MDAWDPIGVRGTPQAHDEYDHYAIDVSSMLMNQRTKEEIAEYLHQIATERIGLSTERKRSEKVAALLFDIHTSSRNRQGLN